MEAECGWRYGGLGVTRVMLQHTSRLEGRLQLGLAHKLGIENNVEMWSELNRM